MPKPNALYILAGHAFDSIYGPDERSDIEQRVNLLGPALTSQQAAEDVPHLAEVEAIFSGWGGPRIDNRFLAKTPKLRIVFYGAGTVKHIVTPEFWQAGLRITSAWAANAVPVAEFTLAQILFSLKHGWQHARLTRQTHDYSGKHEPPGAYGSTVGIISLGMIGRLVCELLRPFNLKIVAYDPFAKPADAEALGVDLMPLEEVFRRSDVVSLHAPWLPETENMITGALLRSMKTGATFINTARGAIVNEPEMIEVLTERPDLFACLDVTWPEPPAKNSVLYELPNVLLTPHIAGSMGKECRRMGRTMVEELDRWLRSEPLKWEISEERAKTLA